MTSRKRKQPVESETEKSWWQSFEDWESLTKSWKLTAFANQKELVRFFHSHLDLSYETKNPLIHESHSKPVGDQWMLFFILMESILRTSPEFGVTPHDQLLPNTEYTYDKIEPAPIQIKNSAFVFQHPTKEPISFRLIKANRQAGGWYVNGFVNQPIQFLRLGPVRRFSRAFYLPSVSPNLVQMTSRSKVNYRVHYPQDPFCFLDVIRKCLADVLPQRELRVLCMQFLFFGPEPNPMRRCFSPRLKE